LKNGNELLGVLSLQNKVPKNNRVLKNKDILLSIFRKGQLRLVKFEKEHFMMRYFLLAVLLGTVFVVSSFAVELTSDLKQKADMVFQGVDDMIMSLNSGICRITGTTIRPGGERINDEILIAFDYSKQLYRFDNGVRARTLLTPEYYYEVWNLNTLYVSIERSLAAEPHVSPHPNFVDIRALFMFVPVGPHRPNDYISLIHQKIDLFKSVNYEKISNDLVKIKKEFPNPEGYADPLSAEFIVNIANGYTVQHIEYSCGYKMEISWKQINKVWVPIAYVQKSNEGFGVEWKIDWEVTNKNISSQYFLLEELVADQESVPIISRELGNPVQIGTLGKDVTSITDQPKIKYPYFRYILIITGLILMFIAFIKMVYDRWKKKD
jgi:hypothetical protein